MPPITLEAIEAKQSELSLLIQQFKAQPKLSMSITYPEIEIELQPGEHYAGPVLDESGAVIHHLVLMAARPDERMNWQACMDWAESVGGALPNRQEQALLYANCKPHLDGVWHWSSQTHEENSSYAWGCGFNNGYQITGGGKSAEGAAVAVRRVNS